MLLKRASKGQLQPIGSARCWLEGPQSRIVVGVMEGKDNVEGAAPSDSPCRRR